MDGAIYEGEWSNDKKEGRGEYVYYNEERYIGDFREDKKEGYG